MVKVLMLGSDMNVYYMSRCYHELYGKKADVLGKEPIRFTRFSSIVNISYNSNLKNPDMFADILVDYYNKHYSDDKVILVPCHDIYVRLVVENYERLKDYYLFNCPNKEIMDNFLIKEKFYTVYAKSGLNFPKTYFYNTNDKLNMPKNFRYPVILKPSDGILYYKHSFKNQAKVYRLNNLAEIKNIIKTIKVAGYTGTLIIQEYIKGDDTNLFDAVFYVNSKGKCELASFAQIGLQEHGPTALGNCTVLINNYNQYGNTKREVKKMKQFLENINYRGFAEFDLKYDPEDKKFKVLEINPRQARSSYYLCACGYNLIKYLIDDLIYSVEHEFTFINKKILLSMVSKSVIKNEIRNIEYRKEALRLYKSHIDPLTYKKEKGILHRAYLVMRKFHYKRKYKKFKW